MYFWAGIRGGAGFARSRVIGAVGTFTTNSTNRREREESAAGNDETRPFIKILPAHGLRAYRICRNRDMFPTPDQKNSYTL